MRNTENERGKLLDSGSECSVIAEKALRKFGLEKAGIEQDESNIVTIAGSRPMLGSTRVIP